MLQLLIVLNLGFPLVSKLFLDTCRGCRGESQSYLCCISSSQRIVNETSADVYIRTILHHCCVLNKAVFAIVSEVFFGVQYLPHFY